MIKKGKNNFLDTSKLLKFNKIERIFQENGNFTNSEKLNYLKKAITESKILKTDKSGDKFKRILDFDEEMFKSKDYKNLVDSKMIYIENLPQFTTREILHSIFSKYGKILHISLPKI